MHMGFLILAVILINGHIGNKRYKYAKGTHQRYVYATWRLILNYTVIVLCIISAGIASNTSDYFTLTMNILVIAMTVFLIHIEKRLDDDNWFNGRWGKIKKGINNLSQSFQRRTAGAMTT
jgi:hypothetical protein